MSRSRALLTINVQYEAEKYVSCRKFRNLDFIPITSTSKRIVRIQSSAIEVDLREFTAKKTVRLKNSASFVRNATALMGRMITLLNILLTIIRILRMPLKIQRLIKGCHETINHARENTVASGIIPNESEGSHCDEYHQEALVLNA